MSQPNDIDETERAHRKTSKSPASEPHVDSVAQWISKTSAATAVAAATVSESSEGPVDLEERPVERLFSERIVEVVVGPSETIWRLHENLLSATSDFFKAAFNSGFKESLEDRILLPEDDPHAFELFVRWLYVRALQGPMGVPEMNAERQLFGSSSSNPSTSYTGNTSTGVYAPATATSATAINIQDCLRLYVLATKLLVEDLENVCVDAAARYYKVGTRRPEIRDVQYIYENTPSGSGMRRLLKERLTLVLFRGRRSNSKDKPVTPEWKEVIDETPELGYDLLSEVSSYNWVPGPNIPPLQRMSGEGCVFHRHEKTELCRPR